MRTDCAHEIEYADSGGVRIAYQVVGSGSLDLLYVPGYISNLELAWEDHGYRRLLEKLASFSRLIVMDKRGSGQSERGIASQVVEDHVGDIGAVLDAAGSTQAAILGAQEGATAALLYAAANPERVSSVIAYSTRARCIVADDYPWGWPVELVEQWLERMERLWGSIGADALQSGGVLSPSRLGDDLLLWDFGRFVRLSCTPREAAAILRMYVELDIRGVLPSVRTPVLVLGRDTVLNALPNLEYLVEHLPNAQLEILEGDELLIWWGDVDAVARSVRSFLGAAADVSSGDRVLATVMFTDFVESTRHNVEVGDRRWREVLDRHDEHVRAVVSRFEGQVVKSTGDGVLATFDGPARAIRCAHHIRQTLPSLGVQVRAGIHTGEVEVRGDDVAGLAVTLASRIMNVGQAAEILVSRTVKDLVAGSAIEFSDRGSHALKGIPDEWQVYEVVSV